MPLDYSDIKKAFLCSKMFYGKITGKLTFIIVFNGQYWKFPRNMEHFQQGGIY